MTSTGLRSDPAFKLACGRLPDSGLDLCSQPTLSRMENLPDLRTVIRLGHVLVDLWLSSYRTPPDSVTLDIDDTLDVVHGHQQLSLFNAHYDERCFLPIHIYDTATGRPVAMILRPGKTPYGPGDPWPCPASGASHPPPLADYPHHHPRRRPLRPPAGHAVVREQWRHLCLRIARQPGSPPSRGRRRRQHPHPSRA